jgi:hypothetical protein
VEQYRAPDIRDTPLWALCGWVYEVIARYNPEFYARGPSNWIEICSGPDTPQERAVLGVVVVQMEYLDVKRGRRGHHWRRIEMCDPSSWEQFEAWVAGLAVPLRETVGVAASGTDRGQSARST